MQRLDSSRGIRQARRLESSRDEPSASHLVEHGRGDSSGERLPRPRSHVKPLTAPWH